MLMEKQQENNKILEIPRYSNFSIGPCPPCPKMVENQCHCGQMPPQPRRCCSKNWSCGQTCSQMLSCQQHKCEEPCHPGKCKKCPRQSRQNCNCGAETSLRECADPNWQCGKVSHLVIRSPTANI